MALRIEYMIILFLTVVSSSLLLLHPDSVEVKESNRTTELVFENFTLIELDERGISNRLSSALAVKDKHYFTLDDVNVSYQTTHELQAKHALYQDRTLYFEDRVRIYEVSGIQFETKDLRYQINEERVATPKPFVIEMRKGSEIRGENLSYNLARKAVSADRIHAHLILE